MKQKRMVKPVLTLANLMANFKGLDINTKFPSKLRDCVAVAFCSHALGPLSPVPPHWPICCAHCSPEGTKKACVELH